MWLTWIPTAWDIIVAVGGGWARVRCVDDRVERSIDGVTQWAQSRVSGAGAVVRDGGGWHRFGLGGRSIRWAARRLGGGVVEVQSGVVVVVLLWCRFVVVGRVVVVGVVVGGCVCGWCKEGESGGGWLG